MCAELIDDIRNIRMDHPRLSCRKMYRLLKPDQLGRDRFEQFCFQNGFKLYRKRTYHRTTDSRGVTRFENLLVDQEFTGVNQAWVSDITYYRISERHYYITLIMDVFSRKIVGYSASNTLRAEDTTLAALQQATAVSRPAKGLIFHSDGGGQYYSNEFKQLTSVLGYRNSMGKCAYENPHAERLNGTIKNDYLIYFRPLTFEQLKQMLERTVYNYNNGRPHTSLKGFSPVQFEKYQIQAFETKDKNAGVLKEQIK